MTENSDGVVPLAELTDSQVPPGGVVDATAVKFNAVPLLDTVIVCGVEGPDPSS